MRTLTPGVELLYTVCLSLQATRIMVSMADEQLAHWHGAHATHSIYSTHLITLACL